MPPPIWASIAGMTLRKVWPSQGLPGSAAIWATNWPPLASVDRGGAADLGPQTHRGGVPCPCRCIRPRAHGANKLLARAGGGSGDERDQRDAAGGQRRPPTRHEKAPVDVPRQHHQWMVEVDDLVESRPELIRSIWRVAEALGAARLLIEIANNPSQLRYARCWAFARLKHRGWLFLFARTNQSGKDI